MKKKIVASCFFSAVVLCGDSLLLSIPVYSGSGHVLKFFLRLSVICALTFCTLVLIERTLREEPSRVSENDGQAGTGRVFKPDPRGYEIFNRGVEYMETEKPYLDTGLSLEKFSKAIFSNTAYVSKSINNYAGMNFKQFVNSYRIDYAVELMKKDPYLRMEEVAQMSGFHTVVSFDMSFKSFKGKTPSEWQREFLRFRGNPVSGSPSMTKGQGQ